MNRTSASLWQYHHYLKSFSMNRPFSLHSKRNPSKFINTNRRGDELHRITISVRNLSPFGLFGNDCCWKKVFFPILSFLTSFIPPLYKNNLKKTMAQNSSISLHLDILNLDILLFFIDFFFTFSIIIALSLFHKLTQTILKKNWSQSKWWWWWWCY